MSKFLVGGGYILDTPNQYHVKSSAAFLESQILKDAAGEQPYKTPVGSGKHGSSELSLPIQNYFWKGDTDDRNKEAMMEHIINPDSAERDAATVEYDGNHQYMLTQENKDPLQNLLDKNNQE